MRTFATLQTRPSCRSAMQCVMLSGAMLAAILLCAGPDWAQAPSLPAASPVPSKSQPSGNKPHAHKAPKKQAPPPAPVVQTPAPPPMPNWPVNDKPSPASVVWDATGLRINASNSSLQQILNEVSIETGTKVEGMGADQRVYGEYGPGQARDVLSQLLQGSGYNILLAGDLGKGAPRQIILSPRQSGPATSPAAVNTPEQDPDEDIPEQPEEQPQPPPPVQPPQTENGPRPGFGPNGPIRTPQQVMEEMQQRQILQQQQMQQQQQNPQD
jgi:hypothetical protein